MSGDEPRRGRRVLPVLLFCTLMVGGFACGEEAPKEPAPAPVQQAGDFSYDGYAEMLLSFVDGDGMVDYKGLKAKSNDLDAFLSAMNSLGEAEFAKWDEKRKIAFWLNAYNAFTLKAIVDHYPIKSSLARSILYPKNSIRQISGVWKKLEWSVHGRKLTLETIEHEILRKDFNEPRIHVALVCAAMGCPPLRNEPFTGKRLNEQLDDQAKRFLSNEDKFRIDRDRNELHLSSVLKWFAEDFTKGYSSTDRFGRYDKEVRGVLEFVAGHISAQDLEYMMANKLSIEYVKYDWTLNEGKE